MPKKLSKDPSTHPDMCPCKACKDLRLGKKLPTHHPETCRCNACRARRGEMEYNRKLMVYFKDDLMTILEEESERQGCSRGEVLRRALKYYIQRCRWEARIEG